ncbi:MAG: porin family protein [Sphingomonadales bacterium]
MNKLLLTSVLSIGLIASASLASGQEKRDSVIIIKKYSKDTLVKFGKDTLIVKSDTLVLGATGRMQVTIDTIKKGTMTIITRVDKGDGREEKHVEVTINSDTKLSDVIEKGLEKLSDKNGGFLELEKEFKWPLKDRAEKKKPKNIQHDWIILDLGFSRYTDASNYAQAQQLGFVGAGIGQDQLKVKTRFASNVNIWLVMQRLNLVNHKLNLKYGIGFELNNYHFDQQNILFQKNPTRISMLTSNLPKKVKLAADYLTIPMMLHFNTNPATNKGLRLSAGASAGFLYSARYKTKSNGDVNKVSSDFDLEPFKFSWVGEMGVRGITLYGSFAMNNMWNKALDMKPYSIGFRLGGTDNSDRKKKKNNPAKSSRMSWGELL